MPTSTTNSENEAKIIGIIQLKGGAGRSTIATNLSAALSQRATVALIDCDLPQGTSASWGILRDENNHLGNLSVTTALDHQALIKKVQALSHTHDFIIIDGPPRIAEMTRAILVMSNLCLLPLGTSAAEVWALSDLFATITEAKQKKIHIDARVIWNRYRKQTRSAREMTDAVHDELDLPQLQSYLGFRVAYSDVLARGLWVGEWRDPIAKKEINALVTELLTVLGINMVTES